MSKLLTFDLQYACPTTGLIGVDEAGRGCLAGPVSTAALWLSPSFLQNPPKLSHLPLDDSKKLTEDQRATALTQILSWQQDALLQFSHDFGPVPEINTHNILGSTRLSMARSLKALSKKLPNPLPRNTDMPLFDPQSIEKSPKILVDGLPLKPFPYTHTPIVKGDAQSLAIALASIIAKVLRDDHMLELHKSYPNYDFPSHKGYGTQKHRSAILTHGPSPEHRELFLRKILQ